MIIILQDVTEPGPLEVIMAAPVASFIFAITIATSIWAFYSDNIYDGFILHPYSVARGRRLYTMITSGMIHADIMHLLFNMLSFYFFAFQLEAGNANLQFAGMGHWQFGVLYVVSLVLSDIPSVYKHRNDSWYHSLGASGAISAVIFSFIIFNPITGRLGLILIPNFDMPAIIFGVLYLVYCNYMSKRAKDNINHDAHFFGALSGMLITIILFPHSVHNFFGQITAWVHSFSH